MLRQPNVSRRSVLISSACLFAWQASGIPAAMAAARRPLSGRVKSLIAQMTIEEKAGQLTLMPTPWTSAAAAKICIADPATIQS